MTGWAGPPTRRTGDDLLERQDVPVEGGPAVGGEPGRRARPLALAVCVQSASVASLSACLPAHGSVISGNAIS